MTVFHIVGFKLPDAQQLARLTQEMRKLQQTCQRNGKPYITSVKGGRQTNPESAKADIDVVFVLEMQTQEDLDYYLDEDPAHCQHFKNMIPQILGVTNVVTIDFTDGDWPTTPSL